MADELIARFAGLFETSYTLRWAWEIGIHGFLNAVATYYFTVTISLASTVHHKHAL